MPPALRIVFFGTPAFAVPTLERLLASRHEVAGVVTQPDRPRGRGQRPSASAVKSVALAAGLPVLQPEKLRSPEVQAEIAALGADLGVVAAYGRLLPESLLSVPRLGMLNVHASLLPKFRGAAPVHRAIMAGERETGVTIMRVVAALDAGPMLAQRVRPIADDETSVDVERDLASIGADLLVETVDRLAEGPVPEVAQDEGAASYAPRITREDAIIDWQASARAIHNRVRGLHPWPHAHTSWKGTRLIILRTVPVDEPAGAPPGTVVRAHGDELAVATGDGVLRILALQSEGRRAMDARAFLAGHRIAAGDVLGAAA